jgi:hypothetical protein
MAPNGEPSNVTCLKFPTYERALEAGAIRSTAPVPEPKAPPPAKVESSKFEPTKTESPPKTSPFVERILVAIRAEGPIGKGRILELSGIPEAEYPLGIKDLLTRGVIEQQGEKRGAKYRVKNG